MKRKQIIYAIKGQISVKCLVSSSFTGTYTGNAQTSKHKSQQELFKNAVYDCIYQHMRQGGKSSPQVKILDYDMNYLGEKQGLIKVKRVRRKVKHKRRKINGKYRVIGEDENNNIVYDEEYKKGDVTRLNKGGKYKTVVTDTRTKEVIHEEDWKYERKLDRFV